jgi:hypothetical protein
MRGLEAANPPAEVRGYFEYFEYFGYFAVFP